MQFAFLCLCKQKQEGRNSKQLVPCGRGFAAGARGFAGAPEPCKGTTGENNWVPTLSPGKKGMLLHEIWSIVKNKLVQQKLVMPHVLPKPSLENQTYTFPLLYFSTCSDAQVLLVTPEQKAFFYRSMMF